MSNLNLRPVRIGFLMVLILAVNISCSTSPAKTYETWEVFVQYPVHHYFSGPIDQRIFQLSPDGSKLASLESHGDFINLVITDLSTGSRQLATNFNDAMVTGYTWANNERLLFYTSDELAIYAVDFDGGNGRDWAFTSVVCKDECLATENPVFLVSYVQVMSRLPAKPDRILVASNHENIMKPNLYELDINTGNLIAIKPGGDYPEIYSWPVDDAGRILQSGIENDEVASVLQFNASTSEWSEIEAGDDENLSNENGNFSNNLANLQRELDVEDIRVVSVDDHQASAVLLASSGKSTQDYYLYNFADESISLLASSPAEIAMIEENPSQIRVELTVVNDRYRQQRPFTMHTPSVHRSSSMSTQDIIARRYRGNRQ